MKTDVIYNQDCLQTLQRLQDNCIDIVITSPPYNMNLRIRKGEYCSRQVVKEFSTKYDGFADNLPIAEFESRHLRILSELLRVSQRVFYVIQIVTGSKRAFFRIVGKLSNHLKDIIVWDKGFAQPAMHRKVLNRQVEYVLVFEKDYPISRMYRNKCKFKRGKLNDLWVIPREITKYNHSAAFPELLVIRILENFSDEGDIVYDPFMGTGTTAIVAKSMNRKYIGSEIVKKYCDLANQRLKDTLQYDSNG